MAQRWQPVRLGRVVPVPGLAVVHRPRTRHVLKPGRGVVFWRSDKDPGEGKKRVVRRLSIAFVTHSRYVKRLQLNGVSKLYNSNLTLVLVKTYRFSENPVCKLYFYVGFFWERVPIVSAACLCCAFIIDIKSISSDELLSLTCPRSPISWSREGSGSLNQTARLARCQRRK